MNLGIFGKGDFYIKVLIPAIIALFLCIYTWDLWLFDYLVSAKVESGMLVGEAEKWANESYWQILPYGIFGGAWFAWIFFSYRKVHYPKK
jgi:hypothetical protein